MAHTCRGTINLANAFIHTEDSCTFVISNGGTQSFHLKASSEVERQRWVTALELAKAKAIALMESGIYIHSLSLDSISSVWGGGGGGGIKPAGLNVRDGSRRSSSLRPRL